MERFAYRETRIDDEQPGVRRARPTHWHRKIDAPGHDRPRRRRGAGGPVLPPFALYHEISPGDAEVLLLYDSSRFVGARNP